jgi:hypothetical protein
MKPPLSLHFAINKPYGIRIRFIKIISVRFLNYIRLNVTYKYVTQAYMANTCLHRFVLNMETYFCRQIYTKIQWLTHAEFDYCFCRKQVSTNKYHDSFSRYICSTKFCEIWEIKCYTQNNTKTAMIPRCSVYRQK